MVQYMCGEEAGGSVRALVDMLDKRVTAITSMLLTPKNRYGR
jgi:hypothetical protein